VFAAILSLFPLPYKSLSLIESENTSAAAWESQSQGKHVRLSTYLLVWALLLSFENIIVLQHKKRVPSLQDS
jgi:hypothetical protein